MSQEAPLMNQNNENSKSAWDEHYTRKKSSLEFPDENLVRLLAKIPHEGNALDFGAGSGRHSVLLNNYGFKVTAADYSPNAIKMMQKNNPNINTVLIAELPYEFNDNQFTLIVSWGILHYNTFETARNIVHEYKRMLAPGGFILGSIRSDKDTHLATDKNKIQLQDLAGAYVKLYAESEIKELFSDAKDIQIGYTERTIVGNLSKKICHWIFQIKY